MKKVDFSKAEENFKKAMEEMQVKKIGEGKEVVSKRASDFYRLDSGSLPRPEDPVIQSFKERDDEEETTEEEEQDELYKLRSQPAQEAPNLPELKEEMPVISPLLMLRNHLDWFKEQKVPDPHKILDTSRNELDELKSKKELTEEDHARIDGLLVKAIILKNEVLKILEIDTDERLIEKQKTKHKTKRFNIKENWFQL